jgi:hypothetical protein
VPGTRAQLSHDCDGAEYFAYSRKPVSAFSGHLESFPVSLQWRFLRAGHRVTNREGFPPHVGRHKVPVSQVHVNRREHGATRDRLERDGIAAVSSPELDAMVVQPLK